MIPRSVGDDQRHLVHQLGFSRDDAVALVPPANWWEACGSLIGSAGRQAAFKLLVSQGCDPGETSLVLTVVAREIEHDQPERAQQYLRHWLPACGSEILLLRALATLCCPVE